MRILVVGDLHARDGNPLRRTDDYKEAIFRKLDAISDLANHYKHNVEHIIFLGDIFDQKRSARVSDELRQRLIYAFAGMPCPVMVVPGNHDLGPRGITSLPRQPLGTLEAAGCLQVLQHGALPLGGKVVLIVRPYDEKGDADPNYYALSEEELIYPDDYTLIEVAHGSVLAPGDDRPYPYVNVDDIPGIEKIDVFATGHIHENLGVHTVGTTAFVNLGSIGRTALTIANLTRTVQVGLIDTEAKSVTPLDVPGVQPGIEVFEGTSGSHEMETPSDEVAAFVARLGEGLRAEQLTIDELLAGEEVTGDVRAIVKRLLEEAA